MIITQAIKISAGLEAYYPGPLSRKIHVYGRSAWKWPNQESAKGLVQMLIEIVNYPEEIDS
jgi:hypothetical protein